MIEVSDLIKDYGPVRAVNGVSFSMKKGEILGFLGPNGAGKSTTMKVLTCFIAPDGGRVTVDGHDVMKDSLEVRRRLGYLPENCPLYEEMGVIEFLRFIAGVRGVPSSRRESRLGEIVALCGLKGVAGKTIAQLSRGYRQRVGLAQAMIHDPDILILDEPTSALDPNQIKEIRELIKDIGKTKSILLSTHIMQEVTATCDRAIIISRGKVVAQGTPESLTAMSRGNRQVHAEISGASEGEVRSALAALPGISEADARPANVDGYHRFVLTTTASAGDPCATIFDSVRSKGWRLRELHEEQARLEDVFAQLTKKQA